MLHFTGDISCSVLSKYSFLSVPKNVTYVNYKPKPLRVLDP